jgi:hypothetical protein
VVELLACRVEMNSSGPSPTLPKLALRLFFFLKEYNMPGMFEDPWGSRQSHRPPFLGGSKHLPLIPTLRLLSFTFGSDIDPQPTLLWGLKANLLCQGISHCFLSTSFSKDMPMLILVGL